MSDFDFRGLTPAQHAVLSLAGWTIGCGRSQPQPRTMRRLIERGLVVAYDVADRGAIVTEYLVPVAVHIAWCARCAKGGRS